MKLTRYPYRNYNEFKALRKKLSGIGTKDAFRLGASEAAVVYRKDGKIGLDEWTSPTVFYYQSVGLVKKEDQYSLPMLRGHIHESINYKDYWRFFDPEDKTNDTFIENRYANRVIRSATKSHQIIVNEKYPWLLMSPDYIIRKSRYSKTGPLEIKSISSRENQKYEAEIAHKYIIQVQHQMLLGGWSYGELFDVQDQTFPRLYQFEADKQIQENIIDSTHDFWLSVLKGKAIMNSSITQLEKEQMLAELAPPDDGNPLYTDFLKERHKPENAKVTIDGDDDMLQLAVDYLKLKEEEDKVMEKVATKRNKIMELFWDTNIGTIQFPVGQINWVEKLSVQKKILKNVE